MIRTLALLIVRIWFRFRAFNTDVLRTPGPVLLVPDHASWLDWLFLLAVLDDDWRFVTSSTTAQTSWIHRKLMVNRRTFPVDTASPYAARRMAEYLQQGGRLVLFAEGRITLSGSLMKLFDGTGFLLHKTRARVITCHLYNAIRVPFVRHDGWTRWFPRVSAHFSDVLESPRLEGVSNAVARVRITTWLRDAMVRQRMDVAMEHGAGTVLGLIADAAAAQPGKVVLEDVSLTRLTFRRLMIGTEVLAEQWRLRLEGAGSGVRVGVLLPNVNAAPVTLLSLWAAGCVPAILNFSTGVAVMHQCVTLAGIRDLITSRAFLEKARLDLEPLRAAGIRVHLLEEVRTSVSAWRRVGALLKHLLSCGAGLRPVDADRSPSVTGATAVVLFTSGSEGLPKGVELTHRNLLANIRQVDAALDTDDHERMLNSMPIFHSMGLTACTLFPLARGFYTFMYPSPLHYRIIPAVVYDKACTIMVATNTFLNGYARRAHPFDFHSLKYLVAGAEKLQEATANTWARRFGVRVIEGYGATECSPAVSINSRMDIRFGSVGRFLPGMEWRLEPVEGITEGGRLFVRGPNVMRGYLNPEADAAFKALDGWYDTGDLARVDEDGYLHLLGRMKRFAKVSGEMVSLTAVEDALAGAFPQYGNRCEVAVIAVPCDEKGEKLIAVSNEPRLGLDEVRAAIRARGLTNLCAPREVRAVREIPKLGTGKVNHRALAASLDLGAAT